MSNWDPRMPGPSNNYPNRSQPGASHGQYPPNRQYPGGTQVPPTQAFNPAQYPPQYPQGSQYPGGSQSMSQTQYVPAQSAGMPADQSGYPVVDPYGNGPGSPYEPEEEKKKGKTWLWVSLSLLLIVVLILGGIWLINRGNGEPKDAATEETSTPVETTETPSEEPSETETTEETTEPTDAIGKETEISGIEYKFVKKSSTDCVKVPERYSDGGCDSYQRPQGTFLRVELSVKNNSSEAFSPTKYKIEKNAQSISSSLERLEDSDQLKTSNYSLNPTMSGTLAIYFDISKEEYDSGGWVLVLDDSYYPENEARIDID